MSHLYEGLEDFCYGLSRRKVTESCGGESGEEGKSHTMEWTEAIFYGQWETSEGI